MMRLETDHYIFERQEPAGREGRELFRACSSVISECGWKAPGQGTGPEEVDRFIFAVAGHSCGEAVLFATLGRGGTIQRRDGGDEPRPFTMPELDKLPIEHSKEPWDALFEAWVVLGFFGAGLRRAYEKGRELAAQAETLTSE